MHPRQLLLLALSLPAAADIGIEVAPFIDSGRVELALDVPDDPERRLLVDGEIWAEGKGVGARTILDATRLEDGPHQISLEAGGEVAVAHIEVLNPRAEIFAHEAPRFLVPGEIAEFRVEAEAEAVEIDFSALDPDFDPAVVEVERGDAWVIRYRVPSGPEGVFPAPIRAYDAEGLALEIDDLRLFRLAAALQPFESEAAIPSFNAMRAKEGDGVVDILEAPEVIRMAGDEAIELPLMVGGELDGAVIELGVVGAGGHLAFPLSGFEVVGEVALVNLPLRVAGQALDLNGRLVEVRVRDRFGRTGGSVFIDPYYTPRESGRLTVTLGWSSAHDLDLEVTEPGGSRLTRNSSSPNTGRFPVDANAACRDRKGREYATWETPPNGRYEVRVSAWGRCGDPGAPDDWVHVSGCGLDQRLIMPPAFGGQPMSFNVACTDMSVSGRARYQRTAASGAAATVDLEGVPMRVLNRQRQVIARGTVGRGGRYEIHFNRPSASELPLTLDLHTDGTTGRVVRLGTATDTHSHTAFSWNPTAARRYQRDFTLTQAQSGAFHILRTIERGHRWYAAQGVRFSRTVVEWTRGQDPTSPATSYFSPSSDRLHLLGRAADPDQFDDSVLTHELSHRANHHASNPEVRGGGHSASRRSHTSLAWSEGMATYLGQSILGTSRYVDRTRNSAVDYRIDSITGVELGAVPANHTGEVAERVVMSFLWDLQDRADATGSDRVSGWHAAVMKSWRALRSDALIKTRGDTTRVDFADFVEHFACGRGKTDRAAIHTLLDDRYDIDWIHTFCKP